jgi:hypothetical protein
MVHQICRVYLIPDFVFQLPAAHFKQQTNSDSVPSSFVFLKKGYIVSGTKMPKENINLAKNKMKV